MTNPVKLQPRESTEIIAMLEDMLEMARRGDVHELVIVASIREGDTPLFLRNSTFNDGWRMLGALRYAEEAVLRGMKGLP
jgi:hypothetical protein